MHPFMPNHINLSEYLMHVADEIVNYCVNKLVL